MDDHDLEQLLRRYRPIAPPADLRSRVLELPGEDRAWLWTAAAAALLVLGIALHESADRTEKALARSVGPPFPVADTYPALRELLTEEQLSLMNAMSRSSEPELPEVPEWP
jgi:hypothetical protein